VTASRNFDVLGLNDDELMHEESLLEALLNHEPDTLHACIEERPAYVAKERVRRHTPLDRARPAPADTQAARILAVRLRRRRRTGGVRPMTRLHQRMTAEVPDARPCDRPTPRIRRTGPCDMCDETGCESCLLAPAPVPGSPDLDEDQDDERRGVATPDPDMRVSSR